MSKGSKKRKNGKGRCVSTVKVTKADGSVSFVSAGTFQKGHPGRRNKNRRGAGMVRPPKPASRPSRDPDSFAGALRQLKSAVNWEDWERVADLERHLDRIVG